MDLDSKHVSVHVTVYVYTVCRKKIQQLSLEYADCDGKMNDVINNMEETGDVLQKDLPEAHEQLHCDIIKCRERELMFQMSEEKLG